jgi:hypothetical protein
MGKALIVYYGTSGITEMMAQCEEHVFLTRVAPVLGACQLVYLIFSSFMPYSLNCFSFERGSVRENVSPFRAHSWPLPLPLPHV